MGNFVLVVEIEVRAEFVDKFLEVIDTNAKTSVATEPACRQFDVLRQQDDPTRVVLYEVYDDLAAFQAHTKLPHVLAFHEAAKPMIVEQKKGRRFDRQTAAAK